MIIFPMVGRSRRFLDAGYKVPKHQLKLFSTSVFTLAVGGFVRSAASEGMMIICLEEDSLGSFITDELNKLGITNPSIVELPEMTLGQADTVFQAIEAASIPEDEALTIFNIDTFRPGFEHPQSFSHLDTDGYLECFIGEGANWSNVVLESGSNDKVIRTSEKQQESEFCCTGLYHFSTARSFRSAFTEERERIANETKPTVSEIFVAPLYNHLLKKGADIRMSLVAQSDVIFCGVPQEYESLKQDPPAQLQQYAAALNS